jgi:predicted SprT family Zn-dependent metalloprotease
VNRTSNAPHARLLELAAPALARCAEAWGEPALSDRLTLAIGRRLHRSLGRCYPERGLVRIAPFVLELPLPLREEIVCHEAAHLVVFTRHGRSGRPHGLEWKELMRSVGFAPRVRIQVADGDPISVAWAGRAQTRYEHRCPVCQVARSARRRMTQWRCRECVTYGLEGLLVISKRHGAR